MEQAIKNNIPNSSMDKGGAVSVRVWWDNLVLSTELLKLTIPVLAGNRTLVSLSHNHRFSFYKYNCCFILPHLFQRKKKTISQNSLFELSIVDSITLQVGSNKSCQKWSLCSPFATNLVIFELWSNMSFTDSAPSAPSLFSDKSFETK